MLDQTGSKKGYIQEIKYDGRVVILDDGSRWVVDELDTITVEMWSETDEVIVQDGEMFKLDDAEKASVEMEL